MPSVQMPQVYTHAHANPAKILALNANALRRDLAEQHELNLQALDHLEERISSITLAEPVDEYIKALPALCLSISSPGASVLRRFAI
ncbi:hypothetical protein RQP46_006122 [Phenoliferia psychrophenolica]